jgi:hypothetical protein
MWMNINNGLFYTIFEGFLPILEWKLLKKGGNLPVNDWAR